MVIHKTPWLDGPVPAGKQSRPATPPTSWHTGTVTDVLDGGRIEIHLDGAPDDQHVVVPALPGLTAVGARARALLDTTGRVTLADASTELPADAGTPTGPPVLQLGPAPDHAGTALAQRLEGITTSQAGLAARLDGVSQSVEESQSLVTDRLSQLDTAMTETASQASSAISRAQDALSTAQAAQSTAQGASLAANAASQSAASAVQDAGEARTVATSARSQASAAVSRAQDALSTAQGAQSTAGQAAATAGSASTQAQQAKAAAQSALTAAQTGPVSTDRLFAGAQRIAGSLIATGAIGAQHVVAHEITAEVARALRMSVQELQARLVAADEILARRLQGVQIVGSELVVTSQADQLATYSGGWSARAVLEDLWVDPAQWTSDPDTILTGAGSGWRIRKTRVDGTGWLPAVLLLTSSSTFPGHPGASELEVDLQVRSTQRVTLELGAPGQSSGAATVEGATSPTTVTLTAPLSQAASATHARHLVLHVVPEATQDLDVTVQVTGVRLRQAPTHPLRIGRAPDTGEAEIAIRDALAAWLLIRRSGISLRAFGGGAGYAAGVSGVDLTAHQVSVGPDQSASWAAIIDTVNALRAQHAATQTFELDFGTIRPRDRAYRQITFTPPIPQGVALRDVRIEVDGRGHPRVNVGVENLNHAGCRAWAWNYDGAQATSVQAVIRVIPPLTLDQ